MKARLLIRQRLPVAKNVLVCLLLATTVAFAQAGGQSGGSTGGGSTGGGSTGSGSTGGGKVPTPQPDTAGQPGRVSGEQNTRNPFPEMQRILYLTGKVQLDDGNPPPEQVLIERVCQGINRPEGYTDAKGRFSFQLGQNNAVFADASVGAITDPVGAVGSSQSSGAGRLGGVSERDLVGCEIRAVLPGFRSDSVVLAGRRALDNPDVGVIVLHRMSKVEGFTFSATSAMAPKDARKAYEKGHENLKKGKFEEAEKELAKATSLYPKYAAAWYELGVSYQQQKKTDEARKAYEEAVAADPKFVSPYAQLTKISAMGRQWDAAADYSSKLIKLNPYIPDAYFYSAVANYNLHHADIAEEHAREAAKMDANHRNPKVLHLLGVILAEKQDYKGAAENMRLYLQLNPNANDALMVKQQLTELEKQLGTSATVQP